MNEKYYRITAYYEIDNFTIIIDSNGLFDKLWKFSAYLVSKGLNIIDATRLENITDTNIALAPEDTEHIILRATQDRKVEQLNNAIKVADKFYSTKKENN